MVIFMTEALVLVIVVIIIFMRLAQCSVRRVYKLVRNREEKMKFLTRLPLQQSCSATNRQEPVKVSNGDRGIGQASS